MKVALVYDRVNKLGGAERVLASLRELFPDAPLYTSVYNKDKAPWADVFHIKTSYLQAIPGASSAHEYLALLMPTAFEQFSFDEYDLVISVTSEAAKGILTKPHTKHISYCLTPTRYLWSGYAEYFSSKVLKILATPAIAYLRVWDSIAAQRPDVMVGISEEVSDRIKRYYNREAPVIYPPVPVLAKQKIKKQLVASPYFLVVSRLVGYKRVDLAVQVCTDFNLPLVVVGVGSELQRLQKMAGPTVQFVGSLTDEDLSQYYEQSTALIFPGEEDFGLTVLEAQSFGKPVIAFNKGGAKETIIAGKTGIFFDEQTKRSLGKVLVGFDPKKYSAEDCRKQASKFSGERFGKEFLALVEEVV